MQFLAVGLRDDEEGAYPSYQLNLVLQGEPTERVNLIENGEPTSLRKMGQDIAIYLNVPFLEQTAPAESVSAEPTT